MADQIKKEEASTPTQKKAPFRTIDEASLETVENLRAALKQVQEWEEESELEMHTKIESLKHRVHEKYVDKFATLMKEVELSNNETFRFGSPTSNIAMVYAGIMPEDRAILVEQMKETSAFYAGYSKLIDGHIRIYQSLQDGGNSSSRNLINTILSAMDPYPFEEDFLQKMGKSEEEMQTLLLREKVPLKSYGSVLQSAVSKRSDINEKLRQKEAVDQAVEEAL